MKKVVAVVTAPFRAIGRLLRRLGRLLGRLGRLLRRRARLPRRLGNPFAKLGKLRGKPRIAAFVVLAVVVLVAVLSLKPAPDESKRVSETLDRFAKASRDKDYQALCDELLASELVERIRSAGLPCEVALRTGLEGRRNPRLTVLGIEVNGDQALARVRGSAVGEVPGNETYRLVQENGSWRIASSPGSGAQVPGGAP